MSELAFRRNFTLQLPSSYVDIESDEMEYVDGGGSITYNRLITTLFQCGMASSIVFATAGYSRVVKAITTAVNVIKSGLCAAGIAGAIIGWYVGWKVAIFVAEIAQALDQHKGLNYGWGWTGPYIYCQ